MFGRLCLKVNLGLGREDCQHIMLPCYPQTTLYNTSIMEKMPFNTEKAAWYKHKTV